MQTKTIYILSIGSPALQCSYDSFSSWSYELPVIGKLVGFSGLYANLYEVGSCADRLFSSSLCKRKKEKNRISVFGVVFLTLSIFIINKATF